MACGSAVMGSAPLLEILPGRAKRAGAGGDVLFRSERLRRAAVGCAKVCNPPPG